MSDALCRMSDLAGCGVPRSIRGLLPLLLPYVAAVALGAGIGGAGSVVSGTLWVALVTPLILAFMLGVAGSVVVRKLDLRCRRRSVPVSLLSLLAMSSVMGLLRPAGDIPVFRLHHAAGPTLTQIGGHGLLVAYLLCELATSAAVLLLMVRSAVPGPNDLPGPDVVTDLSPTTGADATDNQRPVALLNAA